jgi:glycine/D-amino acid oxidase-like deaminating enzyme
MSQTTAEVVICGAGIAGVAAAYWLTARAGVRDVLLVDERSPLTFTSEKSTECYRNWWPGPGDTMTRFMNRSIDLLEELAAESDNYFLMNRRGYVFLTADPARAEELRRSAEEISSLGAGPLRFHRGRPGDPPFPPPSPHAVAPGLDGADLVLDPELIRRRYPFISESAVAMLHPRRCGWVSAQQLGMYLLEQARGCGARLLPGRVTGVDVAAGRVRGVTVETAAGRTTIATRTFINAAGPYIKEVGQMLGVELPVFNELHGKIAFNDPLGIIPRDAPLMIWNDPITLPWSDEEREELAADEASRWLLAEFPAGVHFRPEGGGGSKAILALWTYDIHPQPVVWPPRFDEEYAEIVLRGLARMAPGLSAYFGRLGRPAVDGGYYCKTGENRPLIAPLPVGGAYIIGALSGYGIMASMAAAELLGAHVTGAELPPYAAAFRLERYADPEYQQLLKKWAATSGQL